MRRDNQTQNLLDSAYEVLGYNDGQLLKATSVPVEGTKEHDEWLEKGDWLSLASEVGAEKIFFVDNDPVIVFCAFESIPSDKELIDVFRKSWCMARPQCLFISIPGELRVYSLNQLPARDEGDWKNKVQSIALARKIPEILTKLYQFRREEIESGNLFADSRFGNLDDRADKRLIDDLKIVRRALLREGLEPKYAHALIGRSIFIRYLEDRNILTPDYFERIAARDVKWHLLLQKPTEKPDLGQGGEHRRYHQVLQDKEFTYALFSQLSVDFNGDMFPKDEDEETYVTTRHLDLLRGFLLGDADPSRPTLFFWAYDFKIIPIELISNIYEEFYHAGAIDDKGTHYTPSTIVEYMLSQVLTSTQLKQTPRILDPACGSGIFLVEAFRRIVRYNIQTKVSRLTARELRRIIREQIVGIEINEEAARVTAFSLYLALLHYQEPPDILASPRLPNLVYISGVKKDPSHYHTIFCANAFNLTFGEYTDLEKKVNQSKTFYGKKQLEAYLGFEGRLPIEPHSFDVIVGNPPWFEVGQTMPKVSCQISQPQPIPDPFKYDFKTHQLTIKREISLSHLLRAKKALPASVHSSLDILKRLSDDCFKAIHWAHAFDLPVGENGYSQLFILRAISLIKEDGIIGLLVHSNVIFSQRSTSKLFRQHWLSTSKINQVVNFVHVRRLFFSNSVAPFIFACFSPKNETPDSYFVYLNLRHTKAIEQLRAILIANTDRRVIRQSEVASRDYLWKTYWWGTQQDAALLAALDADFKLDDLIKDLEPKPGYGFQYGNASPSAKLRVLKPLRSESLKWYGALKEEWFEEPPTGVSRQPDERLYSGQRLLFVRGIKDSYGSFARLEYKPFSFRHTICCVPLPSLPRWQAKLITGIFWSSLGRYRMFMTSGTWGTWYDQTVKSDYLSMPIRSPQPSSNVHVGKIISIVDRLRAWKGDNADRLFQQAEVGYPPPSLLNSLDQEVFDLFALSSSERELISDFINYKFDLFVNRTSSQALSPLQLGLVPSIQGTFNDIPVDQNIHNGIEAYLYAFLRIWNKELLPDGEFNWQIIQPPGKPVIAVIFTTQEKFAKPTEPIPSSAEKLWEQALIQVSGILTRPIRSRVYIDGLIRAVSDTQVIIIKRNERWLWTRSAAREDAEATLLQATYLQS